MYSMLDEKLKQSQEGISRLHKIDSILVELESELEELNRKESDLKIIMEKEKYDVEKLEKTSIASLFYSMLGNLEEHIEKERKEALSAKLKYDQVIRNLNDVKDQVSEFNSERMKYIHCEKEYDSLYAEKKEALIHGSSEISQKLLILTNLLNTASIQLKEIQEAILKGKEVIHSMNNALDSLGSAEGWGTWDLFGGGLITDLAKHSNIDSAKEEIENTQRLLRQFKTELVDIHIDSSIIIETDGFGKFADFFFDGLIADWLMQSKINHSQENIYRVKSQVSDIIEKLNLLQRKENSEIEKWKSEIDTLIIKA